MASLLGGEQEYGIGFLAEEANGNHPGNREIHQALIAGIRSLTRTAPGGGMMATNPTALDYIFTENGGSYYYERLPYCEDGGSLEASTPECTTARELAVYLKAQERLLVRAKAIAEQSLADQGTPGRIVLLKSCQDAEAHSFGAQENYETSIASTPFLSAVLGKFAGASSLFIIPIALVTELTGMLVENLLMLPFMRGFLALEPESHRPRFALTQSRHRKKAKKIGTRLACFLGDGFIMPVTGLFFRRQRRALESFLISRMLFSGSGSVDERGDFFLSQKARNVNTVSRRSVWPGSIAIFDLGNCLKAIVKLPMNAMLGRLWPGLEVFKSRQRLQIGLADANRAPFAEHLKFGTTRLMVKMAEDGWLDQAPRFRHPLRALRSFNRDSELQTTAPARIGRRRLSWSALHTQRWYLQRARDYLEANPEDPQDEFEEICRLWEETLELLDQDPRLLIGRIDWVTKQFLLEEGTTPLDAATRQRIDLGYHEIGEGFFEQLEETGFVSSLVTEEALARAEHEPPKNTRAQARGTFIKEMSDDEGQKVEVFWSHGYILLEPMGVRASVAFA